MISTSVAADLLTLCKSTHERQFLQSLGMTIGIKAWVDDFKTMLQESVEMATQPLHTSHSVETAARVTVVNVSHVHTNVTIIILGMYSIRVVLYCAFSSYPLWSTTHVYSYSIIPAITYAFCGVYYL